MDVTLQTTVETKIDAEALALAIVRRDRPDVTAAVLVAMMRVMHGTKTLDNPLGQPGADIDVVAKIIAGKFRMHVDSGMGDMQRLINRVRYFLDNDDHGHVGV